ncbi:hypothetical protein HRI_004957200 [Hibiscus trionum]|uniref:DUF7086 domain-containing protein n=1 Tax=Hibiscus trionum TaxID=183268 RepID=A0A9W7MV48_HIBTR|nr:hypothetical protein HRI_004957200 [Hibiscus trionum]
MKRKNNPDSEQQYQQEIMNIPQVPVKSEEFNEEEDGDGDFLELTLCNGSMRNSASSSTELLPLPPVLPPQQPPSLPEMVSPILFLSRQTPPPSPEQILFSSLSLSRQILTLPPPPPPQQVSSALSRRTLPQQPPSTQQTISSSFALSLSNSHPLFNSGHFGSQSLSSTVAVVSSAAAASAVAISSNGGTTTRAVRPRRNPTRAPREGKSETVNPPFPWATEYRATVHTITHLLSNHIPTITGDVQCKRCERKYEMAYDLEQKFNEIGAFIAQNRNSMHDRALEAWMNPVLPKCKFCNQENSAKPVISDKKKSINWLFLFLGQMIGCCTLDQLKYFCKHTKNHRTGAKDRVIYLTYLAICKQLDPTGPFSR